MKVFQYLIFNWNNWNWNKDCENRKIECTTFRPPVHEKRGGSNERTVPLLDVVFAT